MPEIKYFTVTQTREVKVTANSVLDAAALAEAAFEHGQFSSDTGIAKDKAPPGIYGNTTSRIREIELHVMEGR